MTCARVFFRHGVVVIVSEVTEHLNFFDVGVELHRTLNSSLCLILGAAELVLDEVEADDVSKLGRFDNQVSDARARIFVLLQVNEHGLVAR